MSASQRLAAISRAAFTLAWLLACLTPSWKEGTYSQWPLYTFVLEGRPQRIGAAVLLPVIAGATWLASWLLSSPRRWRWGPTSVTLPVIALGIWGLVRSWPIHRPAALLNAVMGVAIFWGVFAYGLQNWPRRWIAGAFAAMLAVQGVVAVAQFVSQQSLGLEIMGEFVLDPAVRGISVVEAAGQRWLRAYGLTPHPNPLGGYVSIGLLVCLGTWLQAPRKRSYLWVGILPGAAGLLLSFSRGAWLATLIGVLYLLVVGRVWHVGIDWRRARWLLAALFLAALVGTVLLSDLLVERLWQRDSNLELNSLSERLRDIDQAWMLIRDRPFDGVGTGYYVDALWAWANASGKSFPAFQHVHNLYLLAIAELGIGGGLLWLWLLTAPPVALARRVRERRVTAEQAGWAGAFLVVMIVGLLDYYPYFFHNWWTAFYLGALCAGWASVSQEEDSA